jgi:hypothetical protein
VSVWWQRASSHSSDEAGRPHYQVPVDAPPIVRVCTPPKPHADMMTPDDQAALVIVAVGEANGVNDPVTAPSVIVADANEFPVHVNNGGDSQSVGLEPAGVLHAILASPVAGAEPAKIVEQLCPTPNLSLPINVPSASEPFDMGQLDNFALIFAVVAIDVGVRLSGGLNVTWPSQ